MSDTDLKSIAARIRKSPASHEYFFEQLNDPVWLRSLTAMGFFKDAPEPVRSEEWVSYPAWSESRYLVRVGAQAPDEVLKLARKIRPTENPRVHQNILEIAAQLPEAMAAELARMEAKWLRTYTGHIVGIPSAAVPLLTHLAGEGQAKTAFELAGALLAITPTGRPWSGRDAALARMSEYEYAQVINGSWPALIQADPRRALSFLCDLLAEVVHAGDEDGDDTDLTNIWRRAIEDHAQNVSHSLLDTLVDAVRDYSLAVVQSPGGWQIAMAVLKARPEPVFRRIALHLLRVEGSAEDIAAALADHTLAYELDYWHEYGELLRDRFTDLADEQREEVLATLARGPEAEMTPWREERGDTTDDLQRTDRICRVERYVLIAEHLTGEQLREYEVLREEFGEREHPTFLMYTGSWTGPTSPYSEADLTELDPEQLVEKLRGWQPGADPQALSPEGLGRTVQGVVAARPTDFANAANEFIGLDATYVRGLLAGLTDALRADKPFAWRPVLELSAWVLEQTTTDDKGTAYMERDPHWGWARKQVASLLSQAFGEGPAEAPQSERDTIWCLLAVLTDDPDPAPAQETRNNGEGMDPATLAINTTRGEAMHAVVRYVLWVERALGDGARAAGLGFAPEAKAVLERHLDVVVDPSLAIRAVYGQWFPQFVRLDADWARQLAPLVFPTTPDLSAQFDAAWNAYVMFNSPYTDVFAVLREAYAQAVEKTNEGENTPPRSDSPEERLGNHLITYRVLGAMSDDGDDDLFGVYWRAAGSELRKQVLTQAGWSLERSPKLDAAIGERFMVLWGWVFAETSARDPGALAGFGAWLGAPTLDGGWLLRQAQAVLNLGVHLNPNFVVYRALPRLASEHPREAVAVLRGMVLTDDQGWSLQGATDETRDALRLVLASDDEDTRSDAQQLVHLLGARGMTEFRDLVSDD
ncbi:MAG TPA: hypothetical protein VHY18_03420 [Solirubrobacteraceae bacterium]|nr:hypothetical protein [Solirubrobacteraceae bacterium]